MWRQGLFYQLNIYDDRNQILSVSVLEKLFQDIIDDADKHKGKEVSFKYFVYITFVLYERGTPGRKIDLYKFLCCRHPVLLLFWLYILSICVSINIDLPFILNYIYTILTLCPISSYSTSIWFYKKINLSKLAFIVLIALLSCVPLPEFLHAAIYKMTVFLRKYLLCPHGQRLCRLGSNMSLHLSA